MVRFETKYLELSDIRVAYREYGHGPNLILLHGNSESKEIFASYQKKHFLHFHTYAIDSRGHGQSISIDEKYTIEQYSKDVIEFCSVLKIEQAFVIGYSDGGNISLFLALKNPERFNRIIAISPNYLVEGTTDGTLRLFNIIYSILKIIQKIGINARKQLLKFDLMLKDIGLSEIDLGNINTKIIILYAEKDMIKEDHIINIHKSIRNSDLHKIPKCNHLNILNKIDTIKKITSAFHGSGDFQ